MTQTQYAVVTADRIRLLYDTATQAQSARRADDRIVVVPDTAGTGARVARYYDAEAEQYVPIVYSAVRSGAGYGPGPEYRVSYRLTDGRWLNGLRHTDRGDLMTHVEIADKSWV